MREADLMGSLSHPNVVAIYSCGRVEERFFLVMEYVSGSPLRSLLHPGEAWPIARALPLLGKIADALTYMHSRDILHLDLKPENVLCRRARCENHRFRAGPVALDAWTLSELGLVQASLDYCSPEQTLTVCPSISAAILFSGPTMCYELLTGQLPSRVFIPATQLASRPARHSIPCSAAVWPATRLMLSRRRIVPRRPGGTRCAANVLTDRFGEVRGRCDRQGHASCHPQRPRPSRNDQSRPGFTARSEW